MGTVILVVIGLVFLGIIYKLMLAFKKMDDEVNNIIDDGWD